MDQPKPSVVHRYPTRATVAKAAKSTQLEETQLKYPSPVTHQFVTDIINPPELLKYKQLI